MNQSTRIVYLNGQFTSADKAKVSIFDRGLLFGDAVYEVCGVLEGKIIEFHEHMSRLDQSLDSVFIANPLSKPDIIAIFRRLIEENNIQEGLVYMQITRGAADRDFLWPEKLTPTILMFTQYKDPYENELALSGVHLKSVKDIRWARRDIKSVNLLGQVLAKNQAHQANAYEALMIDNDGFITECGSTSFFIVKDNSIITRALSNDILAGITRRSIIQLCQENNYQLDQRFFTLSEAFNADEAFISASSTYILPVCHIDSKPIADAKPGKITTTLREIYLDQAKQNSL